MRENALLSLKSGQLSQNGGACCAGFLRAQHPLKTAEHVEAMTSGAVSAETARKLLSRQSAPSYATLIHLIAAYGPEFLAAVMPARLGWLSVAARAEKLAVLEAEHARLNAELERLRP